jgi:hypothetical protein
MRVEDEQVDESTGIVLGRMVRGHRIEDRGYRIEDIG